MKPLHVILLVISSLAIVSGTFIDLKYNNVSGLFLRDAGIVVLVVFIVLFYKHLKSKNETTSK